ncbi:DUF4401 domain-containing protein [Cellvibrio sp. ARAG 10.3]|uniref:DUF4401 domain-containing protein n=1 Tax=Cellvibrio sp. ARAG 10.3 TaxID=3451358 RepID=UPI003F484610
MNRDTQHLWTQLLTAGLVDGELPARDDMSSPWYIKVLLAFSGWLAAVFLMAFLALGIEIILRDTSASLIIGMLMVAGAYGLLRIPRNEFVEHLALAISLAGQGWIAYSFFELLDDNTSSIWWLIGIMQCLLAGLMPNFIHRVFSSFVAALAFSVALTYAQLPYLFSSVILFGAAWLWLQEFTYAAHLQKIHALGYGLVLALIVLKGTTLFGQELMIWHYRYNEQLPLITPWMGEALTGLVVLFFIWQLLQGYFTTLTQPAPLVILIGTLVLCLVSLEARGITVGLMILLLGFANSNRVLMGLGIIALLFYISTYYYLLDTSLLNKSLSLFVIGVVLLAWRWSLLRFAPVKQEKPHE